MLDVRGIFKSFETPQGKLEVLKGISFQLAAGETLALMGDSGCGKSTLLHVIAGLEPADRGTVLLSGRDILALGEADRAEMRRRELSIIFQQYNLIPSMTVADNLVFEAKLAGRHDEAWTSELISRLGIGDVLARYPEELSGGQQQRVAIARSFAARPALVLADEPTGNLDEANSDRVLDLAFELVADIGRNFVMVTHSARLADRADRCMQLTGGHLQ